MLHISAIPYPEQGGVIRAFHYGIIFKVTGERGVILLHF